jgi:outer membrane protein assembly factor BamB
MVLAYDLNTQEKRWSFSDSERAQEVRSSPAIANLPSQPLAIITTRNKRVLALDLSTGKMVWEAIVRKRCDASPVICDGRAWVGGLDGNLYAFDLKDGNNTWSYQLSGQLLASPAIANGKIVVVSDKGGLYCFGE